MIVIKIDKIKETWASQNIKLNPPTNPDSITTAEEIINFQFPDDFKEFYLQMDGFLDWDWTKNMFSIWPIARILEEYHQEEDKNFIIFADYLINAYHIGFVKGEKGVFKICDETPELIADTFTEALFLIDSDADLLY